MKIFLAGRYNPGIIKSGPEKFSKRLYEFLLNNSDNKSNEIFFISFFFKEFTDGSLYNRLFGFSFISGENNIIKIGIFRLFGFLLKGKPDIIHISFSEIFTIFFYIYKIIFNYRIIVTVHSLAKIELKNAPRSIRIKKGLLERFIFKNSNKLVFVSKLLLDEFKARYNYMIDDRYLIIPNGIDSNNKFNDKRNFLSKNINVVFYNGYNNIIQRGFDFIIDNFKELKSIEINLHIIGVNIHNFNYPGINIINHNFLNNDDLAEFWRDKHFIVKSISFDSFPIMVIEAMASGVIPIISDNIGTRDYIKNGINGFIYSKDDSKPLFRIMQIILNNEYNLDVVSRNASAIKDILNWDKVLHEYLAAYNLKQL